MITTIFAIALSIGAPQSQSEDYVLKSRQRDVASLVQSIHDFTNEPVVLYFESAVEIPELNQPVATIEDLKTVLRKEVKLEVFDLPEGIAIGPIAPHYSEYQFNWWSTMTKQMVVQRLDRGRFPRTEEFSFSNPTYCVPSNLIYATNYAVTIHPMYEWTSLCIMGSGLTFESVMRLVAPAVAGKFVSEPDLHILEPDPQALLRRMERIVERFPTPASMNEGRAEHIKQILTAGILSEIIGKERIDSFLSQEPGVYQESWALGTLSPRLQKTADEYLALMGRSPIPHFPGGSADGSRITISLRPYEPVRFELTHANGLRVVF